MSDDASDDGAPPRREVTHEATGPLKLDEGDLDPEEGDVAVCLCGLSDDYPFCDGTHRTTADEEPGRRYKYVDGERREIAEIRYRDGTDGGRRRDHDASENSRTDGNGETRGTDEDHDRREG